MFHSQDSSSANILTSTPIKYFVYGSSSSSMSPIKGPSENIVSTSVNHTFQSFKCTHLEDSANTMSACHASKSFVQINHNSAEFFNDQVSDSPQEKCQQIRSFEVASHQRIDCQKDDLLLNSLLCNDSPSSVSKTSLCESVSIVCHDNMPLNSHSAVPKQ